MYFVFICRFVIYRWGRGIGRPVDGENLNGTDQRLQRSTIFSGTWCLTKISEHVAVMVGRIQVMV